MNVKFMDKIQVNPKREHANIYVPSPSERPININRSYSYFVHNKSLRNWVFICISFSKIFSKQIPLIIALFFMYTYFTSAFVN